MMNTVRLSYETIGEDNRTERSMNMQAYISTAEGDVRYGK